MRSHSDIEELRRRIKIIESQSSTNRTSRAHLTSWDGLDEFSKDHDSHSCSKHNSADDEACTETFAQNVLDSCNSDDGNDAFAKLLRIAARRECSAAKASEKLKISGFSQESITSAVERAIRCGLIDDARFSDVLVRSRISQGRGLKGIEKELESNDIDPSCIGGLIGYDVTEESELERARLLLEKHPPRSKNKREGAYRFLLRRGYSSSIASSLAREWSQRNF